MRAKPLHHRFSRVILLCLGARDGVEFRLFYEVLNGKEHKKSNRWDKTVRVWCSLIAVLLSSSALVHGVSVEDQARILNAGMFEYMELGAIHMLTGYDHLLFLLGVMFFLTKFSDIVKFITAFTVGHSITLVFATLLGIKANYYLIDAVIALTVCYKAFDNLDGFKKYLDMASPNLLFMVFAFGLIHGFGLSTRLQQLPLGEESLVLKILSFNIGVELGQIGALCIMLVILSGWRKTKSFNKFSGAFNVLLFTVGGLLFLFQLHGYMHTQYPDEFPLNKDDHSHTHEDMEEDQRQQTYQRKLFLQPLIEEEHSEQSDSKSESREHSHNEGEPHVH